jgi:4-alpha-glucanotransferase
VWDLIRVAFQSPSRMAVIPMPDVLCLDTGARMNTPGRAEGNWGWRVRREAFNDEVAGRLKTLAHLYDRDVVARERLLARKAAEKARAAEA